MSTSPESCARGRTASGLLRSAPTNRASPPAASISLTTSAPRSALRPCTISVAPRSASLTAVAAPIPAVAPVTRAVDSVRSFTMSASRLWEIFPTTYEATYGKSNPFFGRGRVRRLSGSCASLYVGLAHGRAAVIREQPVYEVEGQFGGDRVAEEQPGVERAQYAVQDAVGCRRAVAPVPWSL